MLGISLNAYSKIECGETDVTWSRLMQLSHIFELPAAELIQFGEKPFFHFKTLQNTPEPKALWQELEHLRSSYVQKEREAQHLQRIISLLEEKIG
jgi:transcriptional regulator with XRE-family HTH domain